MSTIWVSTLDAEVAYRRELLTEAARPSATTLRRRARRAGTAGATGLPGAGDHGRLRHGRRRTWTGSGWWLQRSGA